MSLNDGIDFDKRINRLCNTEVQMINLIQIFSLSKEFQVALLIFNILKDILSVYFT